MKTFRMIAAATLFAGAVLTPLLAQTEEAQLPGVGRTDLLRADLGTPGRDVIQVLVEFAPGVTAPWHAHPGEEIAYVVEGQLEYTLQGKPPLTLNAGDTLFIPQGTSHTAKNVGSGKALELATYIVEKGKPLVALDE
ncbi:cupin domain-containing protein [Mesorhizobium sp.]|uniref:cupin domain-containing protein n=1 Tax=Mesorhizobium sp. TaxID=1871066 RepID=UPI000FE8C6AF|nr:cupin domain-containing protein [Mesorhizobium sp.]RWO51573.1 MAG: cupin domain-containing protein [Mesorhizobium sp.]TIN28267.1 MAG: cupin domain-containing protein [Mesorhizobium sp.]TIN34655.1 MAG: cupin domain-containing protein [Mesorhizobium sp.]TJU81313.1 MAG: cupin domain-containing protein [Mesorhizobium sp.]TJU84724.1 MAG: cupin domain-containing protein [Mesorhizobium sp.]